MKLCEIYDEGCSSLSFDYTCKIRDGTELEMETQSDTRHNLKTTPTHTNRLFALREAATSLSFIYKKQQKKKKAIKQICDNVYSKQAKKKTINTFL